MKLVTIGDPLDTTGNSFNVAAWLQRHNHARVSKLLDKLLVHIRSEPVQGILVGIGYCFGGKHAFQLAKKGLKVAVAFHPVRHDTAKKNQLRYGMQTDSLVNVVELRRERGRPGPPNSIFCWSGCKGYLGSRVSRRIPALLGWAGDG